MGTRKSPRPHWRTLRSGKKIWVNGDGSKVIPTMPNGKPRPKGSRSTPHRMPHNVQRGKGIPGDEWLVKGRS